MTTSASGVNSKDRHAVLILTSTSQSQPQQVTMSRRGGRRSKRRGIGRMGMGVAAILLAASLAAADCIPLAGSTMCSAFGKAQISTGDRLTGQL